MTIYLGFKRHIFSPILQVSNDYDIFVKTPFLLCFQPRDQFATRAWYDQPSMILDGQRYARQSASDSSTASPQSPDLWSFRNVDRQVAAQVHVAPAAPSVAGSVEPMEVDTTAQSVRGVGNP